MAPCTGFLALAAYVPYWRLDLTTVADVAGGGGRKGTRAVASYDQDATTLAVEAARVARRRVPDLPLDSHLVRHRGAAVPRPDQCDRGARRLATARGMRRLRRRGFGTGRHGGVACRSRSARSRARRRCRCAQPASRAGRTSPILVTERPRSSSATSATDPVLAEVDGWVSLTGEFVDRWRVPGEFRSPCVGGAFRGAALFRARR